MAFIFVGRPPSFQAGLKFFLSSTALTAPSVTQTSTSGSRPFSWDSTVDSTIHAGYFWCVQQATDSAFTNILGEVKAGDQPVEPSDLVAGASVSFPGLPAYPKGGGPLYTRERIARDDGLGGYVYSPWSTTLFDTIAALLTTLDPNNKSTALSVAADNLALTGNDTFNAWQAIATTNTRSVPVYFEVTITAASSGSNYHGVLLGLAGPGTAMPSSGLPTGFQGDGSYSATGHVGVTLGCYIVPASADGTNDGTITSYYAGTAQTPVKHSFKTFQPLTGLYSGDTIKANFGQTAFKYTPPSGAVAA